MLSFIRYSLFNTKILAYFFAPCYIIHFEKPVLNEASRRLRSCSTCILRKKIDWKYLISFFFSEFNCFPWGPWQILIDQQRGKRGARGVTGVHEVIICETYTRYNWVEVKKEGLRCFNGSLETYTRYSRVADEEQKKGLRCFWVILLKGGMAFFFFKRGHLQKSLGNPALY